MRTRSLAAALVACAALAGAVDLIAGHGGGVVEGYPEPADAVSAGFLYNGAPGMPIYVGGDGLSDAGIPLSDPVIGVGWPKNPSTRSMRPLSGCSLTMSSPSISVRPLRVMSHR